MKYLISVRQSMIIAGLLQGAAMLLLHEWFNHNGFATADLVWSVPAYALIVLLPVTFNFLRAEFLVRQSALAALGVAAVVAVTGVWFGWSVGQGVSDAKALSGAAGTGVFVFAFVSLVVWFVGLPFIQARCRENAWRFPYAGLFDDAWRNALLVCNCILFAGLFWALLALWAGLFMVLKLSFFAYLFAQPFFIYIATAMAISFAVSMEEKELAAFRALRRYLLAFKTRLLPLAALIALLFLGALPFSGLDPVWATGRATPLMLCLQLAVISLVNAAWQDGEQPAPFSQPVQWFIRMALVLLPVLSLLSIWALSLRIVQHGWSVDRVWAAATVGIVCLYALSYSVAAVRRGWLLALGKANTVLALVLMAVLLSLHSPLLDPQRISVNSQVARLLAGAVEVENFDFNYLRFSLGREGDEALKALAELAGHARQDDIRRKAKEALARKDRYSLDKKDMPTADEIEARIQIYPRGDALPQGWVPYLVTRLARNKYDYPVEAFKTGKSVPVLVLDLGKDARVEVIVMASPYPVFAEEDGAWRQIGQISFPRTLAADEIQQQLERPSFSALPRVWMDLRLGDLSGWLVLREPNSKE